MDLSPGFESISPEKFYLFMKKQLLKILGKSQVSCMFGGEAVHLPTLGIPPLCLPRVFLSKKLRGWSHLWPWNKRDLRTQTVLVMAGEVSPQHCQPKKWWETANHDAAEAFCDSFRGSISDHSPSAEQTYNADGSLALRAKLILTHLGKEQWIKYLWFSVEG